MNVLNYRDPTTPRVGALSGILWRRERFIFIQIAVFFCRRAGRSLGL
jgi:hypothetical protein